MNAIEIHDLHKGFEGFFLKDISFSVPQGTVMGFVGENGAGKSTTIKCMLNLIKKRIWRNFAIWQRSCRTRTIDKKRHRRCI